jgi:hypothetical protein
MPGLAIIHVHWSLLALFRPVFPLAGFWLCAVGAWLGQVIAFVFSRGLRRFSAPATGNRSIQS